MLQTDLRKSLRASLRRKKKPLISINQMVQYNSYYNIKSLGSAEEMTQFMESVQRKQSVLSSCLLPLSVPSGITANQANTLKTGVVRKMTVGTQAQIIPQYKLENTELPKLMLLHFGRKRLIWDWIILFLVAYNAIIVPLNVAFTINTLLVLDLILELIFMCDIVVNFRTTYIEPKTGKLVTNPSDISKNYLKGWFLVDCIATVPFELIMLLNNSLLPYVAVLKIFRLLRLFRVIRRVNRYIEHTTSLLLLMMFSFALLAHWFACIWYVIGYREMQNGKTTGWLHKLGNQNGRLFYNNTGKVKQLNENQKYINALYFVFTSLTTVGFGNIAPNTVAEQTFSILVLLLGAIVQSAIFGNMTAVIQKLYAARAKFHAKASQIKQFVRQHQIDDELKRRIEDWFISQWSISKGVNTQEMLDSFPTELQADICSHLYKRFLSLPCFMHESRGCLRLISLKIKKTYFSPGEMVIKENDVVNAIFYIHKGTVEVVQKDFIVAILGSGDVFGGHICKNRPLRRADGDIRALMYCEILYLTRESIQEVLKHYPDFAENFSQNISLSFNLDTKEGNTTFNSSGLNSIEEEEENSFSTDSSSFQNSSDEDRRRKRHGRKKTSRKKNSKKSTLPLWQQKLQNRETDLKRSPSASLKSRLMKIGSSDSDEEHNGSNDIVLFESGEDSDDGEKKYLTDEKNNNSVAPTAFDLPDIEQTNIDRINISSSRYELHDNFYQKPDVQEVDLKLDENSIKSTTFSLESSCLFPDPPVLSNPYCDLKAKELPLNKDAHSEQETDNNNKKAIRRKSHRNLGYANHYPSTNGAYLTDNLSAPTQQDVFPAASSPERNTAMYTNVNALHNNTLQEQGLDLGIYSQLSGTNGRESGGTCESYSDTNTHTRKSENISIQIPNGNIHNSYETNVDSLISYTTEGVQANECIGANNVLSLHHLANELCKLKKEDINDVKTDINNLRNEIRVIKVGLDSLIDLIKNNNTQREEDRIGMKSNGNTSNKE
ncbi:potassium voltage-gated channel unc-103-like isoform X2 [Hydractinia symbiolongicarpus]|uniref:potassium voltage-gated channel unc-103-like isoform X2 n=1 Tax=Hydractinia symbiolongicarpus TaxID=13093 RepID=UPI00254C5B18|nr:potassium voltage-gated channel unc-103-like isoform X2 [Hydractinia symbiolongicarpus]